MVCRFPISDGHLVLYTYQIKQSIEFVARILTVEVEGPYQNEIEAVEVIERIDCWTDGGISSIPECDGYLSLTEDIKTPAIS